MEAAVSLVGFRPEHTGELVRMWRESFEYGVGVVDPHPIEEQERYLLDVVLPSSEIRVALVDDRMVGFVAATTDSVLHLYVRKGCFGQGIGTRLLEWAKGQSVGSLWLFAFARNGGARAFYERHGFRIVARGYEPNWKLDDLKYEWRADVGA